MLVKIFGYVLFPLLMSLLGFLLASKSEISKTRVGYRIVFILCFLFSIGLPIKSEGDSDRVHRSELADAENKYQVLKKADEGLHEDNLALQKSNSYMNGKFDTMATVLGSIARHGIDTSDVAKALAASARLQTAIPSSKAVEDREQDAKDAIAKVFGEGERLRAECQRVDPDNHNIGDVKDSMHGSVKPMRS
jgi:hypothetical protein